MICFVKNFFKPPQYKGIFNFKQRKKEFLSFDLHIFCSIWQFYSFFYETLLLFIILNISQALKKNKTKMKNKFACQHLHKVKQTFVYTIQLTWPSLSLSAFERKPSQISNMTVWVSLFFGVSLAQPRNVQTRCYESLEKKKKRMKNKLNKHHDIQSCMRYLWLEVKVLKN